MTLAGALAAAEAAAPVESLDVVALMLKQHLGAVSVSFLITDFTGSSVVRLGAAGSVGTKEPARRIRLRGTLYDDVIRTRQPAMETTGEAAPVRVAAPVANRGDAIGLLELFLPAAPDAEVMREIGETAQEAARPLVLATLGDSAAAAPDIRLPSCAVPFRGATSTGACTTVKVPLCGFGPERNWAGKEYVMPRAQKFRQADRSLLRL